MVIYDSSGNPIPEKSGSSEVQEDMNQFREKVHQEAMAKQPSKFSGLSKQLGKLLSTQPNPRTQMRQQALQQLRQRQMQQDAKQWAEEKFESEQRRKEQRTPEGRAAIEYAQEQYSREKSLPYRLLHKEKKKVLVPVKFKGKIVYREITKEGYGGYLPKMNAIAENIRSMPASSAAGARKYEKSLGKMQQASRGMANFLFPQAGIRMSYSKQERRAIRDELAFLRLQKMKMKLQRQLQKERGVPQRRYRRVPDYSRMPSGLQNYYRNIEAQQSQSPIRGAVREGAVPHSNSFMHQAGAGGNASPPSQVRMKRNIDFFNSANSYYQPVQEKSERWASYQVPKRRGKLGIYHGDEAQGYAEGKW